MAPNPSCTLIVALFGQPSGQATDVASFGDLVNSGYDVYSLCIRKRGTGILPDLHFGWIQAGEYEYKSSNSCLDALSLTKRTSFLTTRNQDFEARLVFFSQVLSHRLTIPFRGEFIHS